MTGSTKYLYMWSAGRLTDGADVFEDRALAVPTEHLPAVDAAPGNRMHVRDLRCLAGRSVPVEPRSNSCRREGGKSVHQIMGSSCFTYSLILLGSPSHAFCFVHQVMDSAWKGSMCEGVG